MKAMLFAAVATSALLASPALANGGNHGGNPLDVEASHESNVRTDIRTDVNYEKDVDLRGSVRLNGNISVNSSAVAVNDLNQISGANAVTYREDNETDGSDAELRSFSSGGSHGGGPRHGGGGGGNDGPSTEVASYAPVTNTVEDPDISGSGNIGVNLAAGYLNMQANSAVLSSSDYSSGDPTARGGRGGGHFDNDAGGWAEASTSSLQALGGVSQYADPSANAGETGHNRNNLDNDFRDRNTIWGATVSGDGNIGLNIAAGSLNQQANLMTLAVATNASLAEANAGLMQVSMINTLQQQDSENVIDTLTISDAAGNIGVNMASGVGNQQVNSLTVASSTGGN